MESLSPFTPDVIERLIVQVPLLQHLSSQERHQVLGFMEAFLRFQPNEMIVKEGAQDDAAMYILISGRAAVTTGEQGEVVLDEVQMGEFFGELSFLTESPRTANVQALEPCIVWRLDHRALATMSCSLREKMKPKSSDRNRQIALPLANYGLTKNARLTDG